MYRSSFRSTRRGSGKSYGVAATTGIAVVALVALFVLGIRWFRAKHDENVAAAAPEETIAAVLTPSPVSASVIAASVTGSASAKLRDVSGGGSSGTASREEDGGQFFLKLKANLGEIDRAAEAYEAWLVRQVPYDYFSVGEFVTNDDGEWVLEWSGAAGTYDGYTRVVVTRERKDGNADPGGHVLEGEFE
ncbi:hypothetical protein EBS80_02365 [bacterium]|nr:hypothetical protein [bacterium]